MNSGLEIVLNNLREQVLRGRKGTESDVSMCSLLTLWMRMKEILKLLQGRRL
jgi:hypothetical protein